MTQTQTPQATSPGSPHRNNRGGERDEGDGCKGGHGQIDDDGASESLGLGVHGRVGECAGVCVVCYIMLRRGRTQIELWGVGCQVRHVVLELVQVITASSYADDVVRAISVSFVGNPIISFHGLCRKSYDANCTACPSRCTD